MRTPPNTFKGYYGPEEGRLQESFSELFASVYPAALHALLIVESHSVRFVSIQIDLDSLRLNFMQFIGPRIKLRSEEGKEEKRRQRLA